MSFYKQGALAPVSGFPLIIGTKAFGKGSLHFYKRGSVAVGGRITNWVAETVLDIVHILLLLAGMFAIGRVVLG